MEKRNNELKEADPVICGLVGRRRKFFEGSTKTVNNPLFYYSVRGGVVTMVGRNEKKWIEREGYYSK